MKNYRSPSKLAGATTTAGLALLLSGSPAPGLEQSIENLQVPTPNSLVQEAIQQDTTKEAFYQRMGEQGWEFVVSYYDSPLEHMTVSDGLVLQQGRFPRKTLYDRLLEIDFPESGFEYFIVPRAYDQNENILEHHSSIWRRQKAKGEGTEEPIWFLPSGLDLQYCM